ncbi:hypothetical protein [Azospirillum halopraeferens]|uniref:hypothetical protein n=1 Tax=Azospirillum halopraeferens TaxID=34010 RepID=UPI00048F2023|nr:hypothetical protein [Azospirillum halopraeferens]
MVDRTAGDRVRRYRATQKAARQITRVEVQVPAAAGDVIRAIAGRYRDAAGKAVEAGRHLDFVLGTINAPRPHPIDAETFVLCLLARHPTPQWQPHMEAFFDEVSEEAIHDLVLAGVVDFEELYRAARTWKAIDGRTVPWIKEMADLTLARPAA